MAGRSVRGVHHGPQRGATTTQWVPAPQNLRSKVIDASHTHTHTTTPHTLTRTTQHIPHIHTQSVPPGHGRHAKRWLQGSLDSATSLGLQPAGQGRRSGIPGDPGPSTGQFSVGAPAVNVHGSGGLGLSPIPASLTLPITLLRERVSLRVSGEGWEGGEGAESEPRMGSL